MLQTAINPSKTFIPKQHRQMDGQTDSQRMAVGRDIGFLHIHICVKKMYKKYRQNKKFSMYLVFPK